MPTYPDYDDADQGGYQVTILYDMATGAQRITFPGSYQEYRHAAKRALELQVALAGAGQGNTKPVVTFWGERPAGFPRNGITLEKAKPGKAAGLPEDYDAPMTGEELSEIALKLHGQKHGRAVNLMKLTGLSRPTIDRQMGGEVVDPVLSRLARLLMAYR